MSFAATPPDPGSNLPSRLRAFLSGGTGIACVILAVALIGATTWALVGDGGGHPALRLPDIRSRPVAGTLFGASTPPQIASLAAEKSAVETLERDLGRPLDIDHNFYPWDKEFPTETESWDLKSGRIPMISWNGKGVATADIAAGHYDALITDRAIRVKRLGQPIFIRWFWEMDGKKKAESVGSPANYIAAWRHIVAMFKHQGATNVSWVWCPNASAFTDGAAQAYYPGDDDVDWTCADGYNWAPGRPTDNWRSFAEIFGGFYDWAVKQKKPIMVGEFGVQERSPNDKAQWVNQTREAIKKDFPLIKAVVYFNANKDFDWRMNTSDSAYQAFKEMANDPWFDIGVNRRLRQ
jgi:hypothetical protein